MKQVKSSFKIVEQIPSIEGMYRHCEAGGRICYRSEDKITEGSYKRLLSIFDERKHYSPLAHGTVYLQIPFDEYSILCDRLNRQFINDNLNAMTWFLNPMWTRYVAYNNCWLITTNYRVIKELNIEDIMTRYWTKPTRLHVKRYSVEVECSRGVFDEWARHASSLAITCESTRYCNYDKDKFGNELTFIEPSWWDTATEDQKNLYKEQCEKEEATYLTLVQSGMQPQQARDILSLNIKCKCMFTGFEDAWEHIFELRTSKAAHPDIVAIMKPLAAEFNRRGFTKKVYE